MRYEIRIAGEGGQGVILAAVILAEALGVHDNWKVAQTQSYGAEVRGGYSKAEVVVSDESIDYQKAVKPDVFVAMNQASCNMYYRDLKSEDGIFIVDPSVVERVPTNKAIKIPFTKIAREEFKPVVANMIMLGSVAAVIDFVESESVEKAILGRVPKGTEELNLTAFKRGFDFGKSC